MLTAATEHRLTELAQLAGCTAKVGADDLARAVEALAAVWGGASGERPSEILVGLEEADDAAVYRLSEHLALVSTLDFFAPMVDDPYAYGAISAANALSDVYAMGGEPRFALNIVGIPHDLDRDVVAAILRGGAEKVREAGARILGGHTVIDAEPKYGLAVTGIVDPAAMLTKAGARPGQALFLTKPIGTGLVCTAAKFEEVDPDDVACAIESMARLNAGAAAAVRDLGVRTATDVTGFGLLGHAHEIAVASDVRLELDASAVPLLPGALECAFRGILNGGVQRNRQHLEGALTVENDVSPDLMHVLLDPQTSGGLLFAIAEDRSDAVRDRFAGAGLALWRIGRVCEGSGLAVVA